MDQQRITIARLGPVTERIPGSTGVKGNLTLCSFGEGFQLYFSFIDESNKSWITEAMIEPKLFESNQWKLGQEFLVNISFIQFFTILPDPYRLVLIAKTHMNRELTLTETNPSKITEFIEQLIVQGIAFPTAKVAYSLEVFSKTYKSLFAFHPNQLSITYDPDLEKLFNNISDFASQIMMQYEALNSIPPDLLKTIASFASCDIQRIMKKLGKRDANRLKLDDLAAFFDAEGRIPNYEELKRRITWSGIEDNCLPVLLPYITRLFKPEMTKSECEAVKKDYIDQFKMLLAQYHNQSNQQRLNNHLIAPYAVVIKNDVARTDRDLTPFKNISGEGLRLLSELLNCYLLFRPDISYLQGMNDLIVPFILAYFPDWDEDGTPHGDNIIEREAMVFWCYSGMINIISHDELIPNLTAKFKEVNIKSIDIIKKLSPVTYLFLKLSGNTELIFIQNEYVLIYKRSFANIWDIWAPMLCLKHPRCSLYLITASVLLKTIPGLAQLNDWTITSMMSGFVKLLSEFTASDVVPFIDLLDKLADEEEKEDEKPSYPEFNSTRFFKAGIIPEQ